MFHDHFLPAPHQQLSHARADQRFRLPAGSYRVRMESAPPREMRISLESEMGTTLTVSRESTGIRQSERRWQAEYSRCEATRESPAAPFRR